VDVAAHHEVGAGLGPALQRAARPRSRLGTSSASGHGHRLVHHHHAQLRGLAAPAVGPRVDLLGRHLAVLVAPGRVVLTHTTSRSGERVHRFEVGTEAAAVARIGLRRRAHRSNSGMSWLPGTASTGAAQAVDEGPAASNCAGVRAA
jgi:hypothetical protein